MGPTLALAVVAISMALVMARLISWASTARTRLWAAVVVFLLLMMAAMFLGLLLYAQTPGLSSVVLGLYVAAGLMAVSVFPVFGYFAAELQRRSSMGTRYVPSPLERPVRLALAVAAIALLAELLMGRGFDLLSSEGPVAPPGGAASEWTQALADTFVSPWFALPMALEMIATWFWVRDRIRGPASAGLVAQAVSMALAPTSFAVPIWVEGTSVASGIIMIAVFVYLAERTFAVDRGGSDLSRYAAAVVVAFSAMTGGIAVWWTTGNVALIAVAIVVQSFVFFSVVVLPERFGASGEAPRGAPVVPPSGTRPA